MTPWAGFVAAVVAGWMVRDPRRAVATVIVPFLVVLATQSWMIASGRAVSPPGYRGMRLQLLKMDTRKRRGLPSDAAGLTVGKKPEHAILIAIGHDPNGHDHRLARQVGDPHVHLEIPRRTGDILPAGLGLKLLEALISERAGIFARHGESLVDRVCQVDFVRW